MATATRTYDAVSALSAFSSRERSTSRTAIASSCRTASSMSLLNRSNLVWAAASTSRSDSAAISARLAIRARRAASSGRASSRLARVLANLARATSLSSCNVRSCCRCCLSLVFRNRNSGNAIDQRPPTMQWRSTEPLDRNHVRQLAGLLHVYGRTRAGSPVRDRRPIAIVMLELRTGPASARFPTSPRWVGYASHEDERVYSHLSGRQGADCNWALSAVRLCVVVRVEQLLRWRQQLRRRLDVLHGLQTLQ